MSWWRGFRLGLRGLLRGAAEDQAEEARQYIEQATAGLVESGLTPADARRAARIELGGAESAREQAWTYGWEHALRTLWMDLRYAARRLRRETGFGAVVILTLALGIGASTAIFSVIDPVLLHSLPYPDASRIAMIWDTFQGARSDVTFHTYREMASRSRSFSALAVFEPWQPTLSGLAQPERIDGQQVSAAYFRVLGIPPLLGRTLHDADTRFRGPHVAILGFALWQRRFGGDRGMVGRQIVLDGDAYTVIGVMPPSFENILSASAEIWRPMQYDPSHATSFDTAEWGHHLETVARLRPGSGMADARRELDAIAGSPRPDFPRPPWASLKGGFVVNGLQSEVSRGVKPALLAISGAVALLLLIACVNVTNLLLARGARRRGEFAMRVALGAGRWRLVRQLLTESLLLALLGGVAGLAVAEAGVRALIALSPPELPRLNAIGINPAVLGFALALTTLAGLAVGLVPALHASLAGWNRGMQSASRRTAMGYPAMRRALVISEVALALVLLAGAGLLLRSLRTLLAVSPGFEPAHLLTMQVQISGHRFDDDIPRRGFYERALEAVQRVPGVESAALTSVLPFRFDLGGTYGAQFEDRKSYDVFRYVATPGYLKTMGIALRRGRSLDPHDNAGSTPVALLSESLARREFGALDPIGRRLHIGPLNQPWYTVVGVVNDVKQTSLAQSAALALYITPEQSWFADDAMWLAVRARGDAAALAPSVRQAVWSVDKDQPIMSVSTMSELVKRSEAQRRFALILFEAFGLAALLLTATGIYGVVSGSVAERTREIGVRAALGATRGDILALVMRQGMATAGVGAAIGLLATALASRALVSLLFGISRLDAITYAAVTVLLLGVAAAACWEPAWRAVRIDPAPALSAE